MTLTIWNESTRDELNAVVKDAVVIIPTGATEQHGPHLATGHDTFAATEVARRAAEVAEGTFVLAPALPFGSSPHHIPFGGTFSLSTETYYRVVRELVESAIAGGARRVFLLNGHGGNHEVIQLVSRDVTLAIPGIAVGAASYWEIARGAIAADGAFAEFTLPGHAGRFETALMLAMEASRVREPRLSRESDPSLLTSVPGARFEVSGAWQQYDGYTDFPHLATIADGVRLLEIVTREVAAAFTTFARIVLPG